MNKLWGFGLIGLIGLISFLVGRYMGWTGDNLPETGRDTVTVLRVDTIREVETRLVAEEVLRVDTVYVESVTGDGWRDASHQRGPDGFDEMGGFDDKVPVPLVRVQRQFAGDNYRAWVSGPMAGNSGPWLDSIDVERDVIETIITVHDKERRRRWGLGVQIGATWDPPNRRVMPYVGVGVSYNLLTW